MVLSSPLMVPTHWLVCGLLPFFLCISDSNYAATLFSSRLNGAFGIDVSQIELLDSVTVGALSDTVAKSCGSNAVTSSIR